jgi:hypothetical protein
VTALTGDRPLVRRRFLRWSSVALIVLAPFAVHAIWGYIEARRLKATVEAIESKGEPTRRSTVLPSGDAARAERYYRAAAALASRFGRDLPPAVYAAERSGEWSRELVERLRTTLADYELALQLLGWAAPLPFEGRDPAGYLGGDLMSAIRLGYLHAILRTLDADAEGAAAALYSVTRAGRYFDGDLGQLMYSYWAGSAVKPVLERTRPSQPSLALLAQAMAEADRDDILRAQFLVLRVELLQRRPADPWFIGPRARPILVVNRPLRTHQVVNQLEALDRLIQAASSPWPERIDAIGATDARALAGFLGPGEVDRERLEAVVTASVRPLAVNRAVRVAVAVERYRREHGEQVPSGVEALVPAYLDAVPIDPFTGKALRFVKEAGGFVAYSLGPNRQDDGGDVELRPIPPRDRGALDPGIRIRYRD